MMKRLTVFFWITSLCTVIVIILAFFGDRISPRRAIQWSPSPKMVIRAMAGVSEEDSHRGDIRLLSWGNSALADALHILKEGTDDQRRMAVRAVLLIEQADHSAFKSSEIREALIKCIQKGSWPLRADSLSALIQSGFASDLDKALGLISRFENVDIGFRSTVMDQMALMNISDDTRGKVQSTINPPIRPKK